MYNPVRSIIKRALPKKDKFCIIDFCAHEPYQTELSKTGHDFYCVTGIQGVRSWNTECRQLPPNYRLIDLSKGGESELEKLEPDFIITHNKLAHIPIARQLAKKFYIPIVHMEHTLPFQGWHPQQTAQIRDMKTDITCTISEYNRDQWGYGPNTHIIHHSIDGNVFSPDDSVPRQNRIITCVNDFINRDWCCGYRLFMEATKGLPVKICGNTPGLSEGTKSIEELVFELRSSLIYCNSSTVSPIPTATLEASACGLAIVSTSNCMLSEIFTNKKDAYLYPDNRPDLAKKYLEMLLTDRELATTMGQRARETVTKMFSGENFRRGWNDVFDRAANMVYTGI